MAAKTFVRIVLTRKNSISSKTLEPSLKLRQNSTSNTFNQFFHYELNLKVFKSSSNPEPFTVISSSIKILICFDKIRWEKARSIDLSEHVKSILYCQKLSSGLLLENFKSKNVDPIKNELNLYFERVKKLPLSKLSHS